MSRKLTFVLLLALLFSCYSLAGSAQTSPVKGIYLSQSTLENTEYLKYLIKRAEQTGINTFVIDFNKMSNRYQKNIQLVKDSGLKYVVRIVVFPEGGTHAQVISQAHWRKKLDLMQQAIALGADEVQLDYIRYNTAQPPSPQNAKNVHRVVKWYKEQLEPAGVPLQADVFGITSFREEKRIGQNVELLGPTVDALCPMVYPSHYEPYEKHAVTPYETVLSSLQAIHSKFPDERPFKLYPYIELSNYRYPLSPQQKLKYIHAQIRATEDGNADGWYAWSASNYYDNLFTVLELYSVK